MRNQKRWVAFFALFVLVALFFPSFGCSKGEVGRSKYEMELVLSDETDVLSGELSLSFLNTTGTNLSEVWFRLYPNAFQKDALPKPVYTQHQNACYPDGIRYGGIEVFNVCEGDREARFSTEGTLLKVFLSEPLAKGAQERITMRFITQIPKMRHRLGRAEDTVNLANFFPILCVFEDGGFVTAPYFPNGDPFYSEDADFEVTLKFPKKLSVMGTGKKTVKSSGGEHSVVSFSASGVRDFAMILSEKFHTLEARVNDVKITYAHYSDATPEKTLQAAEAAIATFSELFGELGFEEITVAQADFVYGGMEFPSLVFVSDATTSEELVEIVVHELAHQWWYAKVGNDQVKFPWLDEGLAQFSVGLFYEQNPSFGVTYDTFVQTARTAYRSYFDVYAKMIGKADTSMRALSEFQSEFEYVNLTYNKGVLLFDAVRETVGEEKLCKGLKTYFKENSGKIATPKELISALERATRTPLAKLFSAYISGKVIL